MASQLRKASRGKWRAARHLMWLDQVLLTAVDDAADGPIFDQVRAWPPLFTP
jgi:hypothetical protein